MASQGQRAAGVQVPSGRGSVFVLNIA